MSDRKILGFVPILEPGPDTVATQAPVTCSKCGTKISMVGGPRRGALCVLCASEIIIDSVDKYEESQP